jgi:hypothetical protein
MFEEMCNGKNPDGHGEEVPLILNTDASKMGSSVNLMRSICHIKDSDPRLGSHSVANYADSFLFEKNKVVLFLPDPSPHNPPKKLKQEALL